MPDDAKLLMVENLDRYFVTHRISVAEQIRANGYEWVVAAGETGWVTGR